MLPGGPVAEAVFADVLPRIEKLTANGHQPGLGTVLVGDDSASAGYIRMKQEQATALGLSSPPVPVRGDGTQADLVAAIRSMNDDSSVDGMLVQHPVPA